MADLSGYVDNFCEQWADVLAAKLCFSANKDPQSLENAISSSIRNAKSQQISAALNTGLQLSKSNSAEQIQMMATSIENIFYQFRFDPLFSKLFSKIFDFADQILSSIVDTSSRNVKALHTDRIIQEEKLSQLDQLNCETFVFLSSLLDSNSENKITDSQNPQIEQIDINLISVIFKYVDHSLPNTVRASAGKILCALSASPKHSQAISDYFWKAFNSCKKDDDFRNFASLIDGVHGLRLSLETPELSAAALNFINSFISNSKKIERGVLRMKFLTALDTIITRLCENQETAKSNSEFCKSIDEIWNIVVKWSAKTKHTLFCLQFLMRIGTVMPPSFFVQGHGKQLFDLLFKAITSTKIDLTALQIARDTFSGLQSEYYEAQFANFKTVIESGLIPTLFKVTPNAHVPKFKTNEQSTAIVEIFVEIGKKKFLPVVDLCRAIFKENDPVESKAGRSICIQTLSALSKVIPDELTKFNDELYQYILPMLLGTSPNTTETNFALPTFPLIFSPDDTVLAQVSQVIFDVALTDPDGINSPAYASLLAYIEKLISFKRNTLTVINYCKTLTNLIATFPKEEILKKLDFLDGIIKSFNIALTKETDLQAIKSGNFALGVQDWVDFRTKFDEALLSLLIHPDKDIVSKSREVEAIFLTDAFSQLDEICLPKPIYNICNLLQDEKGDIIKALPQLTKSDSHIYENIFDALILVWRDNYSRFEESYRRRYIELMGALARPNCHHLKMFLEEIFLLYKKSPIYQPASYSIELTMPELWVTILNELASWMASSGLTIPNFWTPYTNIYFSIARHKSFKEQLEANQKLVEHMERYIAAIWHQEHITTNPNYFVTCNKAMEIIILYVTQAPTHFSHVLEPKKEAYGQFLDALANMINFDSVGKFPSTYLETYLKTLETVFTYSTFTDPDIIDNFMSWLEFFSKQTMQNEQIQKLIVHVLEIALMQNPIFISNYFKNSITIFGLFASQVILAMTNVLALTENNFDDKYQNGTVIVFATVLLHLKNNDPLPRQAAHKLMCVLITHSQLFSQPVPTYLMMCLTSHSTSGYVTQSSHFIEYSSRNITSKQAMTIFVIFTSNFKKMLQFQQELLLMLTSFLSLFAVECPIQEAVPLLLKLTAQTDFTDAEISQSISIFWLKYFSYLQKHDIKESIDIIVNFAAAQSSLKSLETFAAINVLAFAFQMSEKEVVENLYGYLNRYDKTSPKGYDEFIQFVSKPSVDFTKISPQEVIASNAMSQIMLSIDNKETFTELIVPKLAPLTFFSAISYDQDEFAITPFHPLFDAILTTALFRFAKDPNEFSANLAALQGANLVMRASSLNQQYEIFLGTEGQRHIIAYDQNAIRTFSTLLCQKDPKFKNKFFEIVLANTFMVDDNERTMEPFLMLMALIDQLDTRDVLNLMLFSVCAFKSKRAEIVDSIIDIVKERMLSQDLDNETFMNEAPSIIASFILFLSLNTRRSLSIHVVKIIASIAQRALEIDTQHRISKELSTFLNQFGGDEYLASLFVKFIDETTTRSFADPSIDEIIRCLTVIARLISISDQQNEQGHNPLFNWCFLLGFLLESYRFFLYVYAERPIPKQIVQDSIIDYSTNKTTINDFINVINANVKDNQYQHFIVEFFLHGIRSFKITDLYKDTVCIVIFRTYLSSTKVRLNPNIYDNLLKTTLLLGVACDENGKQEAAHLSRWLIDHANHSISSKYFSFNEIMAKFNEESMKPIGYYQQYKRIQVSPESFPQIKLFTSAQETQDVIKFLSEHLKKKLTQS